MIANNLTDHSQMFKCQSQDPPYTIECGTSVRNESKYWSTERRALIVDDRFIDFSCFLPAREYFTHIGSHLFRLRIGLKSVSIIFSL